MSAAASHGEGVGPPASRSSLHTILRVVGCGCALLIALLYGSFAHAGSFYRCVGSSGEAVYSSSAVGYSNCKRESSAGAPAAPRASFQAPPSLALVRGSVETSARVLEPEAPPSLSDVQASVETSAHTPPIAKPGSWNYSDSPGAVAATDSATAAKSPADRVLRGAVYRVKHADGTVEYTNIQPQGQRDHVVTLLFTYISTCIACNLHSPINWDTVSLNFDAYAANIRAASQEFGVDEAFLRAIIHAESAYNPRALSIKGAQGLMQLMPATAGDMGVRDAFDAGQNIRGGARYLGLLLKYFNGNERLAAAAYNAGAAAVTRYNGVPPYAETQVYVERVGTLRRRYSLVARPPLAANGSRLSGPG